MTVSDRLETPRLWLLPTSLDVVRARLTHDTFRMTLDGVPVHFPSAWPGDALALFPVLLRAQFTAGQYTLVDRASHEAVGQLGMKGGPDAAGHVEIGYGLTPDARGRGLATEAVGALCAHLLSQDVIRAVTAETTPENAASQRVLQKVGFRQTGARSEPDDGPLLQWTLARP
ncbi:GNAT family N-acetyltransferase [Deinococcus maricopensis]|uniref:GCN5-related N-acetyltransferase n=1 Tax=Deinococcus maricopensis (strain DSM 21211 / LMG 22137 / NRRL B-23946 / LB-34) TaxID=709986 RepID=E8UC18_DEIML|nr:GNAT family N-acetyltransferase [Deinococcus maricopensis]ADV68679.1 GCN5-related N-acetyltransferase [Deinococcus maricopensis DSM 21211]